MRPTLLVGCLLAVFFGALFSSDCLAQQLDTDDIAEQLARGRYMIVTGHCNNCHTANYQAQEGNAPESEWLTGRKVGHRGPWGTTYPTNLRRNVEAMSETDWVAYARTLKTRPGMAWWSLRETSVEDLTAMYRFIKKLGPSDKPSNPFIPPGVAPDGAVVEMVVPQSAAIARSPTPAAPSSAEPRIDDGRRQSSAAQEMLARGRYMIVTGHCNNCHTQEFGRLEGKVPEQEWLKGSTSGHRGEWGTTFPSNLRINVGRMSEAEWVTYVRTVKALPPMPWWALHQTEISDLRAMYQFIRALGPIGAPSPDILPPGQEPRSPYAQWPAKLAE